MRPGDFVLDFDELFAAFSFLPIHEKPANLLPVVLDVWYFLLEFVGLEKEHYFQHVWVISSAPTRAERLHIAKLIDADRCIMLLPTEADCLKRLDKDETRSAFRKEWRELIRQWWSNYERRVGEAVVKY